MSWIGFLYNDIFFKPVLNSLLFLASIIPGHDLGVAIVLITLLVKIIIFPLTHSMIKTQQAMKKIDPHVKRIYKEIKDKEAQTLAIMELYKEHGINPFSGFISILVQFPLLIAMFQVARSNLVFNPQDIYSFIKVSVDIKTSFLGIISLTAPSIFLTALAAVSQFIQAKMSVPPVVDGAKKDTASMMQSQMVYVFPVVIFLLALKMPAAVPLYWTSMNIFAIVHEAIVRRKSLTMPASK